MADGAEITSDIGTLERVWLGLVFGGPVSAWLTMARIMRVPVDAEADTGDALYRHAEAGARTAARWFPYGLAATAVTVVAFFMWSPVQARLMESVMHTGFHAIAGGVLRNGGPYIVAIGAASATLLAMGLVVGVANASVFGLVPLYVLRRSTAAAAPAVSVALARRAGSLELADYAGYPRVALAVETILDRRRRSRR